MSPNSKKSESITAKQGLFALAFFLVIFGVILYFSMTPKAQNTLLQQFKATPTESISVRTICTKRVEQYAEENKDLMMANSQDVASVNNVYRICLSDHGLPPEDLLTSPLSGNNSNSAPSADGYVAPNVERYTAPNTGGYVAPNVESYKAPNIGSWYEDYQAKQKVKCTEDIAKYNTCLGEYNLEMNEYQLCLADKFTPSRACYKPTNYCIKPVCTY